MRNAVNVIRDWQELSDQVRRLINCDPAYQAIRARREAPSRQMPTERLFDEIGRDRMKRVTVTFTTAELALLGSLAAINCSIESSLIRDFPATDLTLPR